MRLFVAGGAGVVGRRLVPQLVARGHQVTATTTDPGKPGLLEQPPMRIPGWLARLLAGEVAVTMMTGGRGFSSARAKAGLGWELRYPSWWHGFREGLM